MTEPHGQPAQTDESRNLVLCCDGTSNQFGLRNTNVVRLYQCLLQDDSRQLVYYDPGVGTLPSANRITQLGKLWSQVKGLAFGAGLTTDVMEAYAYLMEQWRPGDRVYVFGFSRGAYTARVLAGLCHTFGLLPRGAQNHLPYVIKYYRALSARSNKDEVKDLEGINREFRRTFARALGPGDNERHFPVHFLGLWDTVSSVGWVWDPKSFRHTAFNPSVRFARHAIAIDERRVFFRQNRLSPGTKANAGAGEIGGIPRMIECWFAGAHCDVGGGYPGEEDRLWPISLTWMLQEATQKQIGLLVNGARAAEIIGNRMENPWVEKQHESLAGFWKVAESFPAVRRRKDYQTGEWHTRIEIGRGTPRRIRRGELIHRSALQRLRERLVTLPDGVKSVYNPPSLCATYKEQVRAMAEPLPEYHPYTPANCGCEACQRLSTP